MKWNTDCDCKLSVMMFVSFMERMRRAEGPVPEVNRERPSKLQFLLERMYVDGEVSERNLYRKSSRLLEKSFTQYKEWQLVDRDDVPNLITKES